MTTLAWIFMIVSVSSVFALLVWCFAKVLSTPPPKDSSDPHDRRDA